MVDDPRECETCSWPLDCCTETGAPKARAADCPRDHEVWERRVADARLMLTAAPAAALVEPDEELVGV